MAKKATTSKKSTKATPISDDDIAEPKFVIDATALKDKKKNGEAMDEEGNEPVAKEIVIQPVGYPIRMAGSDQVAAVVVDNEDLFQKYATEQWSTMFVNVGTYLFDSYLFPDFAFQVIGVKPAAGKISPETKIIFKNATTNIQDKISPVKVEDVIGQEDAKRKCRVILEYLKNPDMFGVEWAPRNVLFYGPPGTGKTMMARALASEAKASFLARSATTLIGIHVGDGAKKIHDLYEAAAAVSPVIVFIDELDAIGLSRSFQSVRGDVIEVATALLAELGGMEENKGVVTIGATNQANMLDPALRSRFEEEIIFDIPTLDDRIAMIKAFAKTTPVKVEMNFSAVAAKLDKWTGRDIKEKLMKVLIHDAILGQKDITTEDALALVTKIMKKEKGSQFNPLAI